MKFAGDHLPPFWDEQSPSEPPPETVEDLRATVRLEDNVRELWEVAAWLAQSPEPKLRNVGERHLAWLRNGGNLAKRLGVAGRQGSHRCAQRIVRELEKPSSR